MSDQRDQVLEVKEFESLFRRNHRFLCMIAYKHVADPFMAEDIVQEFFIDFWEKRKDIVLTASFEAYASRAVKYKSISWLRSKSVKDKNSAGFLVEEIEDPALTTEIVAEAEARGLKILQLIDELPAERKRVFLLATTGNLTYKQIAEQLGISVHTVKAQMVKAYAFLRSQAGLVGYSIILYLLFSDT